MSLGLLFEKTSMLQRKDFLQRICFENTFLNRCGDSTVCGNYGSPFSAFPFSREGALLFCGLWEAHSWMEVLVHDLLVENTRLMAAKSGNA